jgi:hypothetical protein
MVSRQATFPASLRRFMSAELFREVTAIDRPGTGVNTRSVTRKSLWECAVPENLSIDVAAPRSSPPQKAEGHAANLVDAGKRPSSALPAAGRETNRCRPGSTSPVGPRCLLPGLFALNLRSCWGVDTSLGNCATSPSSWQ